jgi:hypothetical protein
LPAGGCRPSSDVKRVCLFCRRRGAHRGSRMLPPRRRRLSETIELLPESIAVLCGPIALDPGPIELLSGPIARLSGPMAIGPRTYGDRSVDLVSTHPGQNHPSPSSASSSGAEAAEGLRGGWGKATTDTSRPQRRTEPDRSAEGWPRAENRPSRRLGSTADGPVPSPQDAPARPKPHADSFPRRGRYVDEDASFTYAPLRRGDANGERHLGQRPFAQACSGLSLVSTRTSTLVSIAISTTCSPTRASGTADAMP